MNRRRAPAASRRLALSRFFLPLVLAAPFAAAPSRAQVLPEDDPSIPDSLRFETPAGRAQAEPVAPTWTVDEKSDEFDLVFEELPEDDLAVDEDLSGASTIWPYVHYNRVDAWAVGLDFGFSPQSGWMPEFDVRFAQVFNRGNRWLYVLGLRQPVLSRRRLLLGIEARRFTDHYDAERVASGENLVAAFGFKFDYRDYFERRGVSFLADAKPTPTTSARLVYDRHTQTSITQIAPGTWSLFRNSEPWRENPAIDDGFLASVALEAEWDTRAQDKFAADGGSARARLEWASEWLGSDFVYGLTELEGSAHWSPRHDMFVKGRLLVGTSGARPVPFQRQFAIGGISTLRAHPFKSSRGDQMLLLNAEYQVRVLRGRERAGVRTDLRAIAFADLGQAWTSSSFDVSKQAIQMDVGVGLALADERLALYFAQDLRNSRLDPLMSFRLSQPF